MAIGKDIVLIQNCFMYIIVSDKSKIWIAIVITSPVFKFQCPLNVFYQITIDLIRCFHLKNFNHFLL